MERIQYIAGSIELLDEIGSLWQKLNTHHASHSVYFKEKYTDLTFDHRKKKLLEKVAPADFYILLAIDLLTDQPIGYCVSSLSQDHIGEIDSIFVDEAFRGHGIGEYFMKQSLHWIYGRNPVKTIIGVAAGNEEVFSFYHQFGFYERLILLEQSPIPNKAYNAVLEV